MSTAIFLKGCVKKLKYTACCTLKVSLDVSQNTVHCKQLEVKR